MTQRTLFNTDLTSSDTTAKDQLGAMREDSSGKFYKYVKFITATVVAGDVVKYLTSTKYDASEVEPSATQAAVVAGIALATQAINDFGWIQIGGRSGSLAVNGTGAPAIGDAAISSGTTKALAKGSGEFGHCGTFMDVTGAANVVMLQCSS